MTTMQQTQPAPSGPATEPAGYDWPTLPNLSRARSEGMQWSERLFANVRPCASDGARFMRGLAEV